VSSAAVELLILNPNSSTAKTANAANGSFGSPRGLVPQDVMPAQSGTMTKQIADGDVFPIRGVSCEQRRTVERSRVEHITRQT
jgi:hypothetical protein